MKRPSNFAPHKRQRLKDLWIGRLVCSRKKNKRRRRRIGKNMPKKFVHLSKKNTLKTNLSRRKKAKGFAKEIIWYKNLEIFTKKYPKIIISNNKKTPQKMFRLQIYQKRAKENFEAHTKEREYIEGE